MGKTRDGLTPKQMHFCRCVAAGMSQASAYREAFDVTADGKSATHREAASRLMARADIKARVDALIAQRERSILASSLSDRERVLSKLRHWTDTAEQGDSNKIRAAELLGKSVGLFRDVVETSESKTSARPRRRSTGTRANRAFQKKGCCLVCRSVGRARWADRSPA